MVSWVKNPYRAHELVMLKGEIQLPATLMQFAAEHEGHISQVATKSKQPTENLKDAEDDGVSRDCASASLMRKSMVC